MIQIYKKTVQSECFSQYWTGCTRRSRYALVRVKVAKRAPGLLTNEIVKITFLVLLYINFKFSEKHFYSRKEVMRRNMSVDGYMWYHGLTKLYFHRFSAII